MTQNAEELEIAVIPKGSKVQIMGCRITLVEDAKVEGNQASLDFILKEQENFDEGIGVVGGMPTTNSGNSV